MEIHLNLLLVISGQEEKKVTEDNEDIIGAASDSTQKL